MSTKKPDAIPVAAKPAPTRKVKVKAIALGYYGEKRRRVGDVFVYVASLDGKGEPKLPSWVEPVAANAPEKETGAQAALSAEIRAQLDTKHGAAGDGDDEGESL